MNSDFPVFISKFSLRICNTCRISLTKCEKNVVMHLPAMPNYEDIQLPEETKASSSSDIFCSYICLTARHPGHPKFITGRGHVLQTSTTIDGSNGPYGADLNNAVYSKAE